MQFIHLSVSTTLLHVHEQEPLAHLYSQNSSKTLQIKTTQMDKLTNMKGEKYVFLILGWTVPLKMTLSVILCGNVLTLILQVVQLL